MACLRGVEIGLRLVERLLIGVDQHAAADHRVVIRFDGQRQILQGLVEVVLRCQAFGAGSIDAAAALAKIEQQVRSEEHTSELQSLMRSSYAVFCLKKTNKQNTI